MRNEYIAMGVNYTLNSKNAPLSSLVRTICIATDYATDDEFVVYAPVLPGGLVSEPQLMPVDDFIEFYF